MVLRYEFLYHDVVIIYDIVSQYRVYLVKRHTLNICLVPQLISKYGYKRHLRVSNSGQTGIVAASIFQTKVIDAVAFNQV